MNNEELEEKIKALEEELISKNNVLIYIFNKIYRDNTQLEIKHSLVEKECSRKTEEINKLVEENKKLWRMINNE